MPGVTRRIVVLTVLVAAAVGCGENGAAQTTDGAAEAAAETAPATTAATGVRLQSVGRFQQPVYVTFAPGDTRRIYVVEQGGRIRVVRGGRVAGAPFLDIRSQVSAGGEAGLLGLAFPPDHQRSGRFYVYFTDRGGDQRLVEFRRRSADRADAGSARVVFVHQDEEGNHNGGQLVFGPDGLLYIGTGDGGGGNDQHGARGNAQNLGSPLGKILRIDPRAGGGRSFRIPSSNPFVGRAGARGEVYSYGLRNPWRFSFDRRTGDLAIGDVGQNAFEEIDFVRRGRGRGANFGWRPFEGRQRLFGDESAPGHVPPVIVHDQDDGWCSIIGGYVVRDPGLSSLAGRYVYGDYCKGRIYSARLRSGGASAVRALNLRGVPGISSFGEDARRRVYVVSLNGPVYRLVAR